MMIVATETAMSLSNGDVIGCTWLYDGGHRAVSCLGHLAIIGGAETDLVKVNWVVIVYLLPVPM
eukprot:6487538-Amphidinium_carterae.1